MVQCAKEPISLAFTSMEPFLQMHTQAGIPAAPYSRRRSKLEFDSFLHLYKDKRSDPWEKRRDLRRTPRQKTDTDDASSPPTNPNNNSSKKGGASSIAKRCALVTYVLGVDPPPARTVLGEYHLLM